MSRQSPQKTLLHGGLTLFVALLCGGLHADETAGRSVFQRGLMALKQNEFNEAVAAFQQAVKLNPKEAKYHGLLGTALLRKGQYEQGLAELTTAISSNPNDLGAAYPSPPSKEISSQAIKHGKAQVQKMLKDRPTMAKYGKQASFLTDWAARKFAGEDLGSLIDWDPTPPLHSDAEHLAPEGAAHGAILLEPRGGSRATRDQLRSFEELWAGAVFELHNINNSLQFVRLRDKASKGEISRRQYVAAIVKHEVLAAQQTRAFYVRFFLPFVIEHKLSTDPSLWFTNWWDQPDEALKNFTDKTSYPWRPYARDYDWLAVERFCSDKEYDKAIPLLKQMCADSDGLPDHAEVHLWLGRCRLKLGQDKEALDELSTSIELDPYDAEAYRLRAKTYENLKESQKAGADNHRAEELEQEDEERK
ncbi:MAG: tetratricopeptide repeat protein [Thermoguttaceae bacterium]